MSRAEGKRQRDKNVVDESTERGPSEQSRQKTLAAEAAIAAEMKALEKSKDADELVSQLRSSYDALVELCTQSAETAAAGAQHYVPCAEGLTRAATPVYIHTGIWYQSRPRQWLLVHGDFVHPLVLDLHPKHNVRLHRDVVLGLLNISAPGHNLFSLFIKKRHHLCEIFFS